MTFNATDSQSGGQLPWIPAFPQFESEAQEFDLGADGNDANIDEGMQGPRPGAPAMQTVEGLNAMDANSAIPKGEDAASEDDSRDGEESAASYEEDSVRSASIGEGCRRERWLRQKAVNPSRGAAGASLRQDRSLEPSSCTESE